MGKVTDDRQVGVGAARQMGSRGVWDFLLLFFCATVVCVLGLGAAILVIVRHLNPVLFFAPVLSIGFFAFVVQEYRSALHSLRFVVFSFAWMIANVAVFLLALASFGWLGALLGAFLVQVAFYVSAQSVFGLKPKTRSS